MVMHDETSTTSTDRMRRKRARDSIAKPRLRIVDGLGGDVEVPPIDQLLLLGDQLRAVLGTFAAQLAELEPEQARCRISAADARAAAAEARATQAEADMRDAVAVADDAEARAAEAHAAAVDAETRAAEAERRLAVLGAEHERTVAELEASELDRQRLEEEVTRLEADRDEQQTRAEVADVARAQLAARLDRLVDAFAAATSAAAGGAGADIP